MDFDFFRRRKLVGDPSPPQVKVPTSSRDLGSTLPHPKPLFIFKFQFSYLLSLSALR
jgi:hypothetical protein